MDDHLHRRIEEILRQKILMGAGEGEGEIDESDFVGGFAKGKKLTKVQYMATQGKKISKNGKPLTKKQLEANWKKLLAKRRMVATKKKSKVYRPKPRPRKVHGPKTRKQATGKTLWNVFQTEHAGLIMTPTERKKAYADFKTKYGY